jgi:TMEM175 potassium channel family protein
MPSSHLIGHDAHARASVRHHDADMTDERPRRLSESSRVEAFSDGVFSIAITLLVLELAIPAIQGKFEEELAGELISYVAYLAAFGSIGVLWMGHHTVFSRIRAIDSGLLWRNLVLLLTVSVVPFPTAVIASAFRVGNERDQAAAVVSYAVVGMASGVAWLLLFSYLRDHRNLTDPKTDPHFFRLTEPLLTIVGYGIAALIGWSVSPVVALATFLVFPALYVLRVRSAA